jgi:hypothetical protein
MAADVSVAGERCQHMLVPEIKLFGRLTDFLTKERQRFAKAARVEIGETRRRKGCFEDDPNRIGIAPVSPYRPDLLVALTMRDLSELSP